jgi:hypothetical protein
MLTKTSFVVVFGDNLRGHHLKSDIPRAFAGRENMHLFAWKGSPTTAQTPFPLNLDFGDLDATNSKN